MDIWKTISSPFLMLAAGAFGAVLRLGVVRTGTLSYRQRIGHVVIGSLTAIFVVPAIVEIKFPGASWAIQSVVALGIGLLGPWIAERVIKWADRHGDAIEHGADEIIGIPPSIEGKSNDEH